MAVVGIVFVVYRHNEKEKATWIAVADSGQRNLAGIVNLCTYEATPDRIASYREAVKDLRYAEKHLSEDKVRECERAISDTLDIMKMLLGKDANKVADLETP